MVAGVQLNHRHHHHNKHHHHSHPQNIGVRFVQNKDEGVSAADPETVEDAVPETDATSVAEENAIAATKKAEAKIKLIEEAKETAED